MEFKLELRMSKSGVQHDWLCTPFDQIKYHQRVVLITLYHISMLEEIISVINYLNSPFCRKAREDTHIIKKIISKR